MKQHHKLSEEEFQKLRQHHLSELPRIKDLDEYGHFINQFMKMQSSSAYEVCPLYIATTDRIREFENSYTLDALFAHKLGKTGVKRDEP